VYVEVIGSLVVALFWAFTADTTMPEPAKRGYPLIALGGQLGNIVGPLFLRADRWGFANSAPIVFVLACFLLSMALIMWIFMKVVPKSQLVGYHGKNEEKETEPGLLEGLRLVLTKPYLLGIFAIVMIYEVIVTVFDFYFKKLASTEYTTEVALSNYLANYAVATGVVAFLCVLLGINSIQRRLGMTTSLVLLPVLVAGAVVLLKFNPYLSIAFWIMVTAKAINYALNQPTLKQVYIPTTKDTKYKAAAWLEMFGSRGAKAGGSGINALQGVFKGKYGSAAGVSLFLTVSSGISLSLIVVWLFAAVFVAKKYNRAIERNEVVC
jgi:AAA family ATP:ADP antiporter